MKEFEISLEPSFFSPFPGSVKMLEWSTGKRIIHIGGDVEEADKILKQKIFTQKYTHNFNSFNELCENHLIPTITHETLHVLIMDVVGWDKDTLDNVDSENEICAYGLS